MIQTLRTESGGRQQPATHLELGDIPHVIALGMGTAMEAEALADVVESWDDTRHHDVMGAPGDEGE